MGELQATMKTSNLLCAIGALVLLVAACSGGDDRPPAGSFVVPPPGANGGPEAGAPGDGAAPPPGNAGDGGADTGASACSTPPLRDPPVTAVEVAGEAPTPSGGSVVPGTYDLVELDIYVGATPPAPSTVVAQGTMVVTASSIQKTFAIGDVEAGAGTPVGTDAGYSFNGGAMIWGITCPEAAKKAFPYSATPSTLALVVDGRAEIYAKR
jgi:hypothetical protein